MRFVNRLSYITALFKANKPAVKPKNALETPADTKTFETKLFSDMQNIKTQDAIIGKTFKHENKIVGESFEYENEMYDGDTYGEEGDY